MRVVFGSTVHLLSDPTYHEIPKYPIPESSVPAERLIATGGKICYASFGEKGRPIDEHVKNLIEQHHGSVLEHANVSVLIEGITRACSHEIVRHRHFSYSQQSTRYVDESDAAIVLEPSYAQIYQDILGNNISPDTSHARLVMSFIRVCALAFDEYKTQVTLLDEYAREHNIPSPRKWARGKARNVLPHALETKMVMTGNLRAWRDFVERRSNPGAEAEIRALSNRIAGIMKYVAPTVWADYTPQKIDGWDWYQTNHEKV